MTDVKDSRTRPPPLEGRGEISGARSRQAEPKLRRFTKSEGMLHTHHHSG